MNKKWIKISLMVLIVLLIVVGSYFIFFGNPIEGVKEITAGSGSFPLKKGDNNEDVRKLQQALGISADGMFGSQTEAKVVEEFGTNTVSKSQFNSIV